ncbi:MAG: NYN domain-containing protein, partial [Clostridia bacterium]
LAAGRAHLKHTEGGDFRQATYRAVRQGLMQAESVLLEPWYAFRLELPTEQLGRAISDLRAKGGVFESPEELGGRTRLEGSAPVSAMNGYGEELVAYTRGKGRLSLRPDGYRPCKNAEAVIRELGYAPESDLDNSPDSVFCAHGAGFVVKWDKVPDYMHLESCLKRREEKPAAVSPPRSLNIDERELEAIMEREFGPIRRPQYQAAVRNEAPKEIEAPAKKEYLIVDGYNVIFAWPELKALAKERLDLAREKLMDTLSNYCGYTKAELVLVFDAYRTPSHPGAHSDWHNIHVVYTDDGETADAYIERLANEIGKNYAVRVVTSDSLIRLSALRSGVLRTSSGEFGAEVDWVLQQIKEVLRRTNLGAHTTKLKDVKDGKA